MNKRQKHLSDILTEEGFSIIEKPEFNVTPNQIVLEKVTKLSNRKYRIILDSEGEDDVCILKIIAFDMNYKLEPVEWKAEFGFDVPIQPIFNFIRTLER